MLQTTNPRTVQSMANDAKKGGNNGPPRPPRGDVLGSFVSAYKIPGNSGFAQRIAHFLVGFAKMAPGIFVPYPMIARAIHGLPKTPSDGTQIVSTTQDSVGRARKIAQEEYGCSIASERGVGARATVGDEDLARTRVVPLARGLAMAHGRLAAETGLVDPEKIKDEKLKSFVKNEVRTTLKMLAADDRITRLLERKNK